MNGRPHRLSREARLVLSLDLSENDTAPPDLAWGPERPLLVQGLQAVGLRTPTKIQVHGQGGREGGGWRRAERR